MSALSSHELAFVVKGIQNSTRLDLRPLDGEREISFRDSNLPQTDRSLNCRLGHTEIEISVVFKSTAQTYQELHLLPDASIPAGMSRPIEFKLTGNVLSRSSEMICSLFNMLCLFSTSDTESTSEDWRNNPVFGELWGILDSFKVGLLIEVKIINDDGNVFDLVFRGLHKAFSEIKMPNIRDLTSCQTAGFNLPVSKTVAVVRDVVVVDPTLIEEASADGLVHIFFSDNQVLRILTNGSIGYGEVRKVISAHAK